MFKLNKNLEIKLIVAMAIMVTFTQLRFGFFGIGELILLFLFINEFSLILRKKRIIKKNRVFSQFWGIYLFFLLLGYIYNQLFSIHSTSITFDIISYMVILCLCITLETIFSRYTICDIYKILKSILFFGTSIMFLLFLYSKIGRMTIAGKTLYYGGKFFSPLANDPHQFAYFILPLPFVAIYIITKEENTKTKILSLISIIANLVMGIKNESETLFVAWIIGFFICIILVISNYFSKNLHCNKYTVITIFALFAILFFTLNSKIITDLMNSKLENDNAGATRVIIWTNAIEVWKYSPILGLGPGSFSGIIPFAGYEAHNTLLQIMTQSGLCGAFVYLRLLFNLLKQTRINNFLFCVIVVLIIYGFGINDIRRFDLWLYYLIVFFIAIKEV